MLQLVSSTQVAAVAPASMGTGIPLLTWSCFASLANASGSAHSAFGSCSTEAVGCRTRCCIAQSAPTRGSICGICSICSICSIRVQAAKSVVLKYAYFAILRHLYVGGMAVLCRLSRSIAVRGGRTPVSGYRAHWALLQQYGYLALPQCESLSGMAVWR